MGNLIGYFLNRTILVNLIMFSFLIGMVVLWNYIGKEQMPDVSMNWMMVSIRYPGASADDVELFIVKPVEEKLKGVSGLREISATSAYGSGTVRITIENKVSNLSEKVQDIKDAIDKVDFPKEADDPVYRQFKSSERAIIDVGIYLKDTEILDVQKRIELQAYVLAFKNRLMAIKEVSGIDTSGYLTPELQIKVKPELLKKYEVSMYQVKNEITQQNVRKPIGSLKDRGESEISLSSELDSIESLSNVIITSGFQGQKLKLSDIATIEHGFEEVNSITKIMGHEGVILNIQKSSSVDIISGQKAITDFINAFKLKSKDLPVDFVLMDDESYDVRNRLSLIGTNGVIGFILIVVILFLFLDFKSGFWVAMGIPFSLAFTMFVSYLMGFTINNMTLAAVIIVLGIVVDDAIIVAENISRNRKIHGEGYQTVNSVIDVAGPVFASTVTTVAAFLPLYFFAGRFGVFVKYIPTIVSLTLVASLIESYFLLPSHLSHSIKIPFASGRALIAEKRNKILAIIEEKYFRFMSKVLRLRVFVAIALVGILSLSIFLFVKDFKFVMFPREESNEFRVKVVADENVTRFEMASIIHEVEDIFIHDKHGVVTSVMSRIGQNRRGGEVLENEASLRVEILPPSERSISLKELMKDWEKKTAELVNLKKYKEIRFQKGHFGSDSGSPIVIEVGENNDEKRREIVSKIKEALEQNKDLINVEVERPLLKNEFILEINKHETSRLGINYEKLSTTLRTYIEGDILYVVNHGEEEVDIRLTGVDGDKNSIDSILNLTVDNKDGYLVPLKNLVNVKKGKKPANIPRVNYKRTLSLYADIAPESEKTPLEIASFFEKDLFPELSAGSPTTNIVFRGEVEDTRESESDFAVSVTLVLLLIYFILVILYNSFFTPFLIGAIIPFSVIGTILSFWVHGMTQFGFFAVVGVLGMIGVVINDSIVLVDKFKNEIKDENPLDKSALFEKIARLASTRLRAVFITTITTVAGLFPTAYGIGGYDSMLAEMMLAMGWGLLFGMFITLVLVPVIFSFYSQTRFYLFSKKNVTTLLVLILIPIWGAKANDGTELRMKGYLERVMMSDHALKEVVVGKEAGKFIIDKGLPTDQTKITVTNEYGYPQGNKAKTGTLTGEISKDILETGTSLSLSHTKNKLSDREEDTTEIRIGQSLYNNIFGQSVRLKKEELGLERDAFNLEYDEKYEDLLLGKMTDYLDFQLAYLNKGLAITVLNEAKKLRDNVLKKRSSQIATQTDVERSELLVLIKEEDLVLKNKNFNAIHEKIRFADTDMFIPERELDLQKLINLDDEKYSFCINDRKEKLDLSAIRPIRLLKLNVNANEMNYQLGKFDQRPKLELVAGYDIDKSKRYSSTTNQEDAVIGLKLEIPLGDSKSNASVSTLYVEQKKSEVTLAKAIETYSEEELILRSKIKELLKSIKIQEGKLNLVQKIIKAEENRFNYGKIELDKLIDIKNSFSQYRFEYQSDKIELNKAIIECLALNDLIVLSEGL